MEKFDRNDSSSKKCAKRQPSITGFWAALCTWQSPTLQTPWPRHSLSARRWSSSGPLGSRVCATGRGDTQRETSWVSLEGTGFIPMNEFEMWKFIFKWMMSQVSNEKQREKMIKVKPRQRRSLDKIKKLKKKIKKNECEKCGISFDSGKPIECQSD